MRKAVVEIETEDMEELTAFLNEAAADERYVVCDWRVVDSGVTGHAFDQEMDIMLTCASQLKSAPDKDTLERILGYLKARFVDGL